jgi:crotonobetainyl-CoA:carnitine CoA-transferase CaiB-like acyl-CoA transferase
VTTPEALQGIRIIDLSMGWAGPLCCRHMADMGADVIKVESCERFDWWRSWEATPAWIADDGAEKSTAFNMVNRNKRDITLDLEHPEGRALLLRLVATADAVVENFSGSVLPRLDLGYEQFRAVKEDIILLSMPAFGSTGPWAGFRAYGSTVEQASGLPHLNGRAEDPPTMQHVALGDAVGGLTGASALLIALRHQARTGEGQYLDLSQVEGLFPLGAHGILEYAATGEAPRRQGNRTLKGAPHGVYPCRGEDEWIVIEVTESSQWQAFKETVGAPLTDIGSMAEAIERGEEVDAATTGWTADRDARELMMQLQRIGVPAACTHRASTILRDPHLEHRSFWQFLDRAVVGRQPNPSPPYRIGKEPIPIKSPAPTLGQHNEEVLGGVLGLSASELARLEDLGIIGTRPRMPNRRGSD